MLKNQSFCDSAKTISKRDIIFALVQYQHEIIFALLLFCSETSDEKQLSDLLSVFDAENTIFLNFRNNEYDVMIEREVIFHATSGANDLSSKLTSCNGYISRL